MILTLFAILTLGLLLPAQCNGTYPVLVGPANTGFTQDAGCEGFSSFPGATPPWSSPVQWLSGAAGGQLDFVWSRLPTPPFPSPTFNVVMLMDVAPLPGPVFVAVGSPCQIVIGGGVLIFNATIPTNVGCPLTSVGYIPPLPALVGLTLYGQGVINDPVSTGFATTNAWKFTL